MILLRRPGAGASAGGRSSSAAGAADEGPDGVTTHQSEVQARDVDDVVLPASSLRAFDALSAHVALLDGTGRIRWVNEAWRRFGIDNGADPRGTFEGADYDAVCEAALPSPDAGEAHDALRLVPDGHSFGETVEYPCHAPDRERWFRARFERIAEHGEVQIVAVHENVTDAVFAARGVRETARLTRQLQTALLGRPAVCRHYDVATSYRPGDSRLLLGGDFLDVL